MLLLFPLASAAEPLSVAQAVDYALAQASDYQIARSDEAIADTEARNARAGLLPALGGEAAVLYNSPAPNAPGTQSFLSENSVMWYRATIGATGTLGLGQGGQVREARALLAAAHAGTEVARRELAQATIDAYYGVALAHAQLVAAQDNATTADELARVTALRFDAGEVPEVDVLRTRLLAATRHDELLQGRAAVESAFAQLGGLLGSDEDWTVAALDGTPVDATEVEGLARAVEGGDGRVPAVEAAASRVEAARAGVVVARGEFLPSLDYAVGFGVDTDTLGKELPQHLGVVAGVTLTVPVFDWGIGARSVGAAKLAASQAEVARGQAERAARAERRTTASAARSSALRAQALDASLADAERNVTISVARYAAGEADLVEVTEAQQTLVDTRYARNGARAELQDALGHLRLLAGQRPLPLDPPAEAP